MRCERPEDFLIDGPVLVRRLYGVRAETDEQTAKKALSAAAQQVLVAVSENPDQRVDDIAKRLWFKSSTVSNALRELKDHKLVRSDNIPGKGPRQRRRLTPRGEREVAALVARARELLDGHASKPQG